MQKIKNDVEMDFMILHKWFHENRMVKIAWICKIFLSVHRGVNIIQFRSISVSFGSIYIFLFECVDGSTSGNLSANQVFQSDLW